jgi:hypothetical protein
MRGSVLKIWGVEWIPNGSGEDLVMGCSDHSKKYFGSMRGGEFWNQVNESASQEGCHLMELFIMGF